MKTLLYSDINQFNEGYIAICSKGRWGFINKKGERVIPCKYSYTRCFSEKLAAVKKGKKFGFIDESDREVIPFVYDFAGDFSEGLAAVKVNEKYGFIGKSGNMVIPCQYDNVGAFSSGLASVSKDGKYGFIDTKNNIIIPFEYDYTDAFVHNVARVQKGDKVGYIDKKNKIIIPIKYKGDYCFNAVCGVISILESEPGNIWSLYNNEGKLIKKFSGYTYIGEFHENTAPVSNTKGQWGIIDIFGEFIIPCKYERTMAFFSGIACAVKGDKIGFIDKSDNEIIPFDYDDVSTVGEGFVLASSNKITSYIIDRNGDIQITLLREKSVLLITLAIIAFVTAFLFKIST